MLSGNLFIERMEACHRGERSSFSACRIQYRTHGSLPPNSLSNAWKPSLCDRACSASSACIILINQGKLLSNTWKPFSLRVNCYRTHGSLSLCDRPAAPWQQPSLSDYRTHRSLVIFVAPCIGMAFSRLKVCFANLTFFDRRFSVLKKFHGQTRQKIRTY